jgi:Ca2+-binding RTX toxin-like protein
LIITLGEGDSLTVEGAANTPINFTNSYVQEETGENASLVAQVAEDELNYDSNTDLYWATGDDATVTVGEDVEGPVSLWLGGHDNARYDGDSANFRGNINNIDATNYAGDATLVGNAGDNVITAGSGNNSLWGGSNGDDTLIGGDGADLFWYDKGNGNDVIENIGAEDTVNLENITLDDLAAQGQALFNGNDIVLKFKDTEDTLTIKDGKNSGATFTLADGTVWTADDSAASGWKQQN